MSSEPSLDLLEDWEEWNPESGTSFVVHAIAGSAAGAMEHCLMFPADTMKTYLQAETGMTEMDIRSIVRAGGFLRLWRGVTTMLFGCVPAHAAYFSVYEHSKGVFGVDEPGHHPIAAASAGACSTIAHDCILTPTDVVKQRLQLGFHSGFFDCVGSVLKNEGAGALFRSFPTTLLMNIPYAGIMVATNESIKLLLNPMKKYDIASFFISGAIAGGIAAAATNPLDVVKTRLQTQQILNQAGASNYTIKSGIALSKYAGGLRIRNIGAFGSHMHPVVHGALDGGAPAYSRGCRFKYSGRRPDARLVKGTTTVVPSQTRETYSFARGFSRLSWKAQKAFRYHGLKDTVMSIYAEEGPRGFARGIRPRLMVHVPSVAISWTTYEVAKSVLSERF